MNRLLLPLTCIAVLCGCERAAAPAPSPPAAAAPAAKPPTGKVAEAATLMALFESDPDAVLERIGAFEYAAHRKLLTVSGLEAELGGAEPADRALRALMLEMKQRTSQWQPPRWTPMQNAGVPNGTLGVAQAVVELTAVALDFESLYGDGQPSVSGHDSKEGSSRSNVSDGAIEYHSTLDADAGGLHGKFQTRMKVNLCPDANGKVTLEASTQSSVSRGNAGTNVTIEVQVVRTVSDDAHYIELETQAHVENASFGGGAGTFVDMDLSAPATGAASQRVNRRSSQASDGDVQNAAALAQVFEVMAVVYTESARDIWEHDKCVTLEPSSEPAKRTKTRPSTSFSVLAAPRSKVDGSPVGGTVTATLSGDSSLDPTGTKVRSDAKFRYVAPGEKKKTASVAFEARSKRGVAKAELAFDTNEGAAYSAEGGADDFHGTGEICDIGAPFTIAGSGNTVKFVPRDANGGTYTYSGTMSGFDVYGNGTYTVKYAGDVAVSITATGPGSVKTPAGVMSRVGTEQYTLTPRDADCAAP